MQLREWLGSSYDAFQWQLNLLYSVYSAPNIILPLVGGILVDRLGPNITLGAFSSLVCIGSSIFALGVSTRTFPLMLFGRLIFGLGGESLEVAQAKITTEWFRGRGIVLSKLHGDMTHSLLIMLNVNLIGLGFALGLNLSSARIATAMNDNLSPYILETFGITAAVWNGFIICLLSFLSAVLVIILNRPASPLKAGIYEEPAISDRSTSSHPKRRSSKSDSDAESEPLISSTEDSAGLRERSHPTTLPNECLKDSREHSDKINSSGAASSLDDDSDEKIHIKDIWKLHPSFWVLCLCCIALYASTTPFIHISSDCKRRTF